VTASDEREAGAKDTMDERAPARQDDRQGPAGRPHVRVGDDERRRVVAELQRHYVAGRLAQDELDERIGLALAARTYGDFDGLLHDLPPDAGAPAGSVDGPTEGSEDESGRSEQRDFRAHALSYVLVMALLVAIWLLTTPGGYFWPAWPMLGWGLGLAAHGMSRTHWLGGSSHRRRRRRHSA